MYIGSIEFYYETHLEKYVAENLKIGLDDDKLKQFDAIIDMVKVEIAKLGNKILPTYMHIMID